MLQRVNTYQQRQLKNQLYLQKIKSDLVGMYSDNKDFIFANFNPRKSIVIKRNKSQSMQM